MNKKLNILGYIFIIWFLASMGGMAYFVSVKDGMISLVIFGQTFLVSGVGIAFEHKKTGSCFALTGAIILSAGLINIYGSRNIIQIFNQKIIPVLAGLVFIGVGIANGMIPMYFINKKLKKCTIPIEARCVRLELACDGDYYPVWEYYINGRAYTYDGQYLKVNVNVGDSEILYLNPNDVNEACVPFPLILKIVGWVSVGLGILVISTVIYQWLIAGST